MSWSWKQILAAVVVAIGCASCGLEASPVEPDLELLLKTPPPTHQFTPARAGWNGRESAGPGSSSGVSALDRYSPEASALALRRELQKFAIPDWRFASALIVLIIMLRIARLRIEEGPAATPARPSDRLIRQPEPESLPEELNPAA
jgi:hypothetical protein